MKKFRLFLYLNLCFGILYSCQQNNDKVFPYAKALAYVAATWSNELKSGDLPDSSSERGLYFSKYDSVSGNTYAFYLLENHLVASYSNDSDPVKRSCIVYDIHADHDIATGILNGYSVDSVDSVSKVLVVSTAGQDEEGGCWLQKGKFQLTSVKLDLAEKSSCSDEVEDDMPERWESLQFVFVANGGVVGYYKDGKRVGCPRCGLSLDYLRQMDKNSDYLMYAVKGDQILVENSQSVEELPGLSELKACWDRLDNGESFTPELKTRMEELKQQLSEQGWVMAYGNWLIDPPDDIQYGYTPEICD